MVAEFFFAKPMHRIGNELWEVAAVMIENHQFLTRKPTDSLCAPIHKRWRPHWEVQRINTLKKENGGSDNSIVSKNLPKDATPGVAGAREERRSAPGIR